jgi:hypothetical protein
VNARAVSLIFVLTMVAVVVVVDVFVFRHHFQARLIANVGIVLVFLALYWTFFRRR